MHDALVGCRTGTGRALRLLALGMLADRLVIFIRGLSNWRRRLGVRAFSLRVLGIVLRVFCRLRLAH